MFPGAPQQCAEVRVQQAGTVRNGKVFLTMIVCGIDYTGTQLLTGNAKP